MLTEVAFFAASLGLGVVSGGLHRLFSVIFGKFNSRTAAVTVQFLLAAASVSGFTLIAFLLNDGSFTLYSASALTIGFFIAQILLVKSRKIK